LSSYLALLDVMMALLLLMLQFFPQSDAMLLNPSYSGHLEILGVLLLSPMAK
jgi:hypothetical protein